MIEVKTGIYKITSPTGKIYIGQSVNIHKRFTRYKNLGCVNQPRLYNSFIKYGVENHVFEIIEECLFEEMNIRERYWQEHYDVISNKGLNCFLQETLEVKRKLTLDFSKLKSKVITDLNLKKKENIYQYDINGNFLQKWNNTTEIKIKYPDINSNSLSKCLNPKYKIWNAYGYIWKKDEVLTQEELDISIKKINYLNRDKTIIQYDLEGNFIKEWKSMKQIYKVLNLQVSKCVYGKVSNTIGFIWKYKKDNFDIKNHKLDKVCFRKTNHNYPIYQYNKEGELIRIWEKFEDPKYKRNVLRCVLNERRFFDNHVWSKILLSEIEFKNKYITSK